MHIFRCSLVAVFSTSLLMSACSTRVTESSRFGSRLPATESIAPQAQVPFEGGKGGTHAAPSAVTAPVTSSPAQELQAQCSMRLDQVPIGGGYSVMDLLIRTESYGTFSGQWEMDRQILRPFFAQAGDPGPGSEVYALASRSPAWGTAIDYINGSARVANWAEFHRSARMAAILVAIMQVARQPECVRWIRQNFATRLLGADADKLDAIPLNAAVTSFSQGTIAQAFAEFNKSKLLLDREFEALDRRIRDKEKSNKSELAKIQSDLGRLYQDFRKELLKIPGCSASVRFQELTLTTETSSETLVSALTEECKNSIEERLRNAREEELRHIEEAERHRAKRDPADDGSDPSEQEIWLNERVKATAERVQQLQALADRFTTVDKADSILRQSEAIAQVLGRRSQLVSKDFYRAEVEQRTQLQRQMDFIAPQWMTFGYFGGFQSLNSLPSR